MTVGKHVGFHSNGFPDYSFDRDPAGVDLRPNALDHHPISSIYLLFKDFWQGESCRKRSLLRHHLMDTVEPQTVSFCNPVTAETDSRA